MTWRWIAAGLWAASLAALAGWWLLTRRRVDTWRIWPVPAALLDSHGTVRARTGPPGGPDLAPPTPTHEGRHLRAWDALKGLDVVDPPRAEGKWAELLPCIPEGGNYQHLTARGDGPEVFGYRTRYWSFLLKLARDRPAWTLPAVPGPSTGPFHWDNRPLAVEERLALQGFPREWTLKGRQRDLVRLAGNATPPPLAEAAGRQIAGALSPRHLLRPGESSLALPRLRSVPAAAPPGPLPSRFLPLVGSKAAHPGVGAGPGRRRDSAATAR